MHLADMRHLQVVFELLEYERIWSVKSATAL